jgi:hypothetical protein
VYRQTVERHAGRRSSASARASNRATTPAGTAPV